MSVGIEIRYGLDGPGIESRCRQNFPHPSRLALGSYQACYSKDTGSVPGVKRPWRDTDRSPDLAPKLKAQYSYTSTHPLGLHGLS
jgi:hypothetical protein